MKNYLMLSALITVLATACKEKKDKTLEPGISALSIIKGQVNMLDTSFYEFIKYENNGNVFDTLYLKREEVRKFAQPFLSLPDLTDKKNSSKYTEEKLIDAQTDKLSIISTLKDEEASEVLKQIMVIDVADVSSAKVQSIYIDRNVISKDSIIEQKLFWEIDKYFTINNTIIKENLPDKTNFTKVTWQ